MLTRARCLILCVTFLASTPVIAQSLTVRTMVGVEAVFERDDIVKVDHESKGPIVGALTARKQSGSSWMIIVGGKSILEKNIKRINILVDELELEDLSPHKPEQYFELGQTLSQYSEDSAVRNLAVHLLRVAIELDARPSEAHGILASLLEGDEATSHMAALLNLKPSDEELRDSLRENLIRRTELQDLDEFMASLQAARKNAGVSFIELSKSGQSSMFDRLAYVYPKLRGRIAKVSLPAGCAHCSGSGECRIRRPCRDCKNGKVKVYSGRSTSGSGGDAGGIVISRANYESRPCYKCNGRGHFLCQSCSNSTSKLPLVCRTCGGKESKTNIPRDLIAQLGQIDEAVSSPTGTWKRELLMTGMVPFRPIHQLSKGSKPGSKRYYRVDKLWVTGTE